MEPKIEWSRTRKNLFFKCPRAWYLRYGYKTNSSRSRAPSFQRPWDLMLRAMKETLLDRLDDLKEGKEWSSLLVEVQLKSSLQSHLDGSVHHVSEQTQNALLKFAQNRFLLLWRTRILQQLQKRRHETSLRMCSSLIGGAPGLSDRLKQMCAAHGCIVTVTAGAR